MNVGPHSRDDTVLSIRKEGYAALYVRRIKVRISRLNEALKHITNIHYEIV